MSCDRMGSNCLMGTEFPFRVMKIFGNGQWFQILEMVAQHCECNECHWIVHLEMVKMILYVKYVLPQFFSEKNESGVDFRHGWIQDSFHFSGFLLPTLALFPAGSPQVVTKMASGSSRYTPFNLATWAGEKCFFPNTFWKSHGWISLACFGHELGPQSVSGVKGLEWCD